MTEQQKHFPEFYVTAPQACPYLPGRLERKLFTHLTHDKPAALIDNLLKGGFRRSQNIAYMPYCEGCHACVSVRVLVDEFEMGRTMRRVMDRNSDLVSRQVAPVPTSEQYSLFRSYIDTRHADGGMADMSVLDYAMMVEDSVINTFLTEYREKPAEDPLDSGPSTWPLKSVALCDRLSDGISMVYSFYDPEDATAQSRHAHDPRPYRVCTPSRLAIPVPRLLDSRLAQDELQDPLSATGTADCERVVAGSDLIPKYQRIHCVTNGSARICYDTPLSNLRAASWQPT